MGGGGRPRRAGWTVSRSESRGGGAPPAAPRVRGQTVRLSLSGTRGGALFQSEAW
eukprot:COSAG02_NODE_801_length_17030_cov_150.308428_10_plen_55_part_00